MLNTRWLLGLILVVSTALPACDTKTSLGREAEDADQKGADAYRQVPDAGQTPRPETGCTYAPVSVDLSCNDDPNLPTVAGSCDPEGTCTCRPGFVLNPTSKRCKLDATSDAGVVICRVGADQTCNDEPWASWVAGTCVGGVACACATGYLRNPATGKCKRAPLSDAGPQADGPAGQVCTFLLDQTCNDDDTFSGIAGHCEKGATCGCNSGFVINPATGRCRAGANPDAAATPDAGVGKDTIGVVVDAPVGKDLGKDSPGVCTFGQNQTCNDSPIASWVAGTCQSNGTCVCDSGFVLNPSSGRCAYQPKDAGPDLKTVCTPGKDQTCNDSPASALWGVCLDNGTCSCTGNSIINASTGKCMRPEIDTCAGTYTACGCGCCGGVTPTAVCYYPSAGDSLASIKSADEAVGSSPTCEMAGCAMGQRYLCCTEAAAEPAGNAQYSATFNAGGYDRISIRKTGNDGNCVLLGLTSPVPAGTGGKPFRLTTPTGWGMTESLSVGACDSPSPVEVMGAQGTITLTPSGTSCAINAHMTVFLYAAASGTLTTVRIDADDIAIAGGVSSTFCK